MQTKLYATKSTGGIKIKPLYFWCEIEIRVGGQKIPYKNKVSPAAFHFFAYYLSGKIIAQEIYFGGYQ